MNKRKSIAIISIIITIIAAAIIFAGIISQDGKNPLDNKSGHIISVTDSPASSHNSPGVSGSFSPGLETGNETITPAGNEATEPGETSDASPVASMPAVEEIKAPSNLKVSGVHETRAVINWTGNAALYKIEISGDGSTYQQLAWVGENTFNITKLEPNKTYWVRVYSADANKNLAEVFVSASFSTKEIKPITSVNVSYITDTGAIIKWSGGTGKYQVKISTDGSKFTNYITYTDKNSADITKLKSNTRYWVRIYNLDGNKALTNSYESIEFTTGKKIALSKVNEKYKTYVNSYYKGEYVRIDIINNNSFEIKGANLTKDKYVSVFISNNEEDVYHSNREKILPDGSYTLRVNTKLPEGKNELVMFFGESEYGIATSRYFIDIYVENGELFFKTSPVYGHNYKFFIENTYIKEDYLKTGLPTKDHNRIKELAESIIKGIDNDYDKVKAIFAWVSDNIYYNWDGFISGRSGKNDPISVLDSKKAVCAGYAELTAALLRSINIPCKVVSGFAMGAGTSGNWEAEKHNRSNHAWNEVYVDGRWIIIDSTWSSNNRFIDGKFEYKGYDYSYFDCSLEYFSNSHKILDYK